MDRAVFREANKGRKRSKFFIIVGLRYHQGYTLTLLTSLSCCFPSFQLDRSYIFSPVLIHLSLSTLYDPYFLPISQSLPLQYVIIAVYLYLEISASTPSNDRFQPSGTCTR
ncbi:hypothetical protein FGO68_gene7869 [Halteria grandinella]|uniref:Uncharacterized protein n=1 Tax=Halteria grandinella TaxID=5974 RepID=A0A8J8T1K2_HALGN|nr:hypothetical protein FGO68_gene7869 [Halteria grandinella]